MGAMPQRQDDSQVPAMRLWLSDQQWMGLLEQVERKSQAYRAARPEADETQSANPSGACLRREARHAYACRCALRTLAPNGTSATYVVQCRNLSANGLGFLTHQALEEGTRCTVALQGTEGQGCIVSARVAWHRSVSPDVYEVGVQFDQPVSVEMFVEDVA